MNNLIASKLKLQHEFKRSKVELDALHREYSQIMSERDSVHKEIEALQEQLCKEKDKFKTQNINEIDLLKKELQNVLQERDKAVNEVILPLFLILKKNRKEILWIQMNK